MFLPDGTFLPLPKLAIEPFLKLWEQEVLALLLGEGKVIYKMGGQPAGAIPQSRQRRMQPDRDGRVRRGAQISISHWFFAKNSASKFANNARFFGGETELSFVA